jgi:aldose 1-epimerase
MKALVLFTAILWSLRPTAHAAVNPPDIREEFYGKLADGRDVKRFTLENSHGCRATVSELGAVLISVEVPDRDGKVADVTLGHKDFDGWATTTHHFGATVGRFGNRIAGGTFRIDGKEYTLAKNSNSHGIAAALHGGLVGFDKKLWKGVIKDGGVEMTYLSPDGEEGYPGNLAVTVRYTFNEANELTWAASATTDAPTVVNLIQHAYWNLSGDPTTSTNDHELTIESDAFLLANAGLIPTGERVPVAGTPMDFTKPMKVGARMDGDFEPMKISGGGYDNAWILRGTGLRQAARLKDPESGRVMTVITDAPALQVFTPNFDGKMEGKGGLHYQGRGAVCLETEAFPDAPNHPDFPSQVLRPGETYRHTLTFKFSVE